MVTISAEKIKNARYLFFLFQQDSCPRNMLFDYLERYKFICEKLSEAEIETKECEDAIKKCCSGIWTAEKRVHLQTVCFISDFVILAENKVVQVTFQIIAS